MSVSNTNTWKILLSVCILVIILSLISLPNLYLNISGDSVPNRPQKEPPVVYQWDQALARVILVIVSLLVGVYSWNKIRLY